MLIHIALMSTALSVFVHIAQAQTNITSTDCAASSDFSTCNNNVASKWNSCLSGCNGDENCNVNCGCNAHQEYINCMAQSCWNQVYSCKYQLFVQQYFTICPSAAEPIPFWPAPSDAPNRCSCNLGKVLQTTLTARSQQVACIADVTDDAIACTSDLSDFGSEANIAETAADCACCGASTSLSAAWDVCPDTEPTLAGADLWPTFFSSDWPNLYTSLTNFTWDSCGNMDVTKCNNTGFSSPSDKFYKPGSYPSNGTSTLRNVGGTLSAPPSGTVITWSQSSTTWTVTATGYDEEAVASQNAFRATATGTAVFATETSNVAAGVRPRALVVGIVGVLVAL